MPTTYAHDLFGKLVYRKLDPEAKRLIHAHQEAYLIGLHGPDILFYYRPFCRNHVTKLGHRMHSEDAYLFFDRAKKVYQSTQDPALLAYLMGFICHFMLDSTCHPYIAHYMRMTGAGHDEIETELDRELMLRTGKDPFQYLTAKVIHAEPEAVTAIAAVLDGITEKEVRACLHGMRFYTGVTVCSHPKKRAWLLNLSKASMLYPLVHGRIMREEPIPRCVNSTRELVGMFRSVIPETVEEINTFFADRKNSTKMDARFHKNFK
ncbi:MAG: zinc dependent phospholipase C family protein [Eubacteriales bacterium]|nr:zinc dependent phospholipase C family protein [Eubacteriales bacterium]